MRGAEIGIGGGRWSVGDLEDREGGSESDDAAGDTDHGGRRGLILDAGHGDGVGRVDRGVVADAGRGVVAEDGEVEGSGEAHGSGAHRPGRRRQDGVVARGDVDALLGVVTGVVLHVDRSARVDGGAGGALHRLDRDDARDAGVEAGGARGDHRLDALAGIRLDQDPARGGLGRVVGAGVDVKVVAGAVAERRDDRVRTDVRGRGLVEQRDADPGADAGGSNPDRQGAGRQDRPRLVVGEHRDVAAGVDCGPGADAGVGGVGDAEGGDAAGQGDRTGRAGRGGDTGEVLAGLGVHFDVEGGVHDGRAVDGGARGVADDVDLGPGAHADRARAGRRAGEAHVIDVAGGQHVGRLMASRHPGGVDRRPDPDRGLGVADHHRNIAGEVQRHASGETAARREGADRVAMGRIDDDALAGDEIRGRRALVDEQRTAFGLGLGDLRRRAFVPGRATEAGTRRHRVPAVGREGSVKAVDHRLSARLAERDDGRVVADRGQRRLVVDRHADGGADGHRAADRAAAGDPQEAGLIVGQDRDIAGRADRVAFADAREGAAGEGKDAGRAGQARVAAGGHAQDDGVGGLRTFGVDIDIAGRVHGRGERRQRRARLTEPGVGVLDEDVDIGARAAAHPARTGDRAGDVGDRRGVARRDRDVDRLVGRAHRGALAYIGLGRVGDDAGA